MRHRISLVVRLAAMMLLLGVSWNYIGLETWEVSRSEAAPVSLDHSASQLRRPLALAVSADGGRLFVANRDSGTVTSIDTAKRRVLSETRVAEQLADLVLLDDGRRMLALDHQAHRLLVLEAGEDGVRIESSTEIASFPVTIELAADRQSCAIASLWSHRVSLVSLRDPLHPQVKFEVELPFAPRALCMISDSELVVGASFGGLLALIDTQAGKPLRSVELHGHNIREIQRSQRGDNLRIPHQVLQADGYTTKEGVHWGGVIRNVVRSLPIERLRGGGWPPERDLYYLGNPDRATGDPSCFLETASGREIVCYAGLGEVAISDVGANYFRAIDVGRRPTALALSPDETELYVANMFSDSVTLLAVESGNVQAEISLGPQPALTAANRGEMLFYDADLSSDGWFSCHSCHTDGHSNGLLSDNLGDGGFGAPKRVLSLLGVGSTEPWAWNGSVDRLETQVSKSIELTMHGGKADPGQVEDLTAYLRTLAPATALRHAADRQRLAAGYDVFRRHNCASCHPRDSFTSHGVYDVGVQDEQGNRDFNPPSLLGVSQRSRYFHDNRADSLRAVFGQLQHGIDGSLSGQELADLVVYLESL